jgi:ABC-type xylose transport system permease subunit
MDRTNSSSGGVAMFSNREAARFSKFQRKALHIVKQAMGVLVLALTILIATEKLAYAYTDPGSAALLWQIAVSSLIGVAYYFRKFIIRLVGKGDKARKEQGVGGD